MSSYFLAKDYGCGLGYWWHIFIMSVLPSIVTPALLSSIRNYPHLPHHIWYFIAATTLSVLNCPDEIPKVYKHAMDHGAGAAD
jgi:hypothetical protein